MVPWVGLLYVIVAFPDHTHLLFATRDYNVIVSGYVLLVKELVIISKTIWLNQFVPSNAPDATHKTTHKMTQCNSSFDTGNKCSLLDTSSNFAPQYESDQGNKWSRLKIANINFQSIKGKKSKKDGKDQETIQSSTTPDPEATPLHIP